jgi:hypothetical protein
VNDPITAPPDLHLSFVACVSSQETLHANLLASPFLHADSPHEVILVKTSRQPVAGLVV